MILSWYYRRKRAVCLGTMGHAEMWLDPETSEMWQARSRYALFTAPAAGDSVEDVLQMLDVVHSCELYVEPEEVLSQL